MVYKDIPYNYAFTFKVPVEGDIDREFNVVISNYREDSKDFSGLCLENETRVISEEKMLFAAFFDIVDRIIRITIEGERGFVKAYRKTPEPLMSVNDEDFLKKFDKYKQSRKSLEYYERLRVWFEAPKTSREKIPQKPTKPDIFVCQSVVNFFYLTQERNTPIKEVGFFTI
jgi:hypothetical protein